MQALRLHVWREWREHRFALLALAAALPVCTSLLSMTLGRGSLGDLFRLGVTLAFMAVFLVVVGGELLGGERRSGGSTWLERQPAGLVTAFRAKLVFFLVSIVGAAAVGWCTTWLIGVSRHAPLGRTMDWGTRLCILIAIVWSLWTFAVSAWTLRGGL